MKERWSQGDSAKTRSEISAQRLRHAFEISPSSPPFPPTELKTDWQATWEYSQAIQDLGESQFSPAFSYLQNRAISTKIAGLVDVRFSTQWHHRPTLVFPFKSPDSEVVAIAGRCLKNGGMDKPASGPKKLGAFWAPTEQFGPLDALLPAVIVCEAPFDALSLAQAGFRP